MSFLPWLVGLQFLISGLSKSIDARYFFRFVSSLRLVPRIFVPTICIIVIGLEWALAFAIFFSTCDSLVFAAAIGTLIFFSVGTVLLYAIRNHSYCGCYGPSLSLSPLQSISINILSIVILIGCWNESPCQSSFLQPALIGSIVGIFLSGRSAQKPLFDLSPIRVGAQLVEESIARKHGFVLFLTSDCQGCDDWLPILEFLQQRQMSFTIVTPQQNPTSLKRFTPIAHVPRDRFFHLIGTPPVMLFVQNGKILYRWLDVPSQKELESLHEHSK